MLKDNHNKTMIIIKKLLRSIVVPLLNVKLIIALATYSAHFNDIYYDLLRFIHLPYTFFIKTSRICLHIFC